MAASLLITLREGFEAALIVAIAMAYLRQVGRQDTFRYVWLGTAAALALAFAIGLIAWRMLGGLEGDARRLTFALICFAYGKGELSIGDRHRSGVDSCQGLLHSLGKCRKVIVSDGPEIHNDAIVGYPGNDGRMPAPQFCLESLH